MRDFVGIPQDLTPFFALNKDRTRPLALISAPAGYGKSVLVASWLEHSDWSSVWLSLDADDSDLRIFLTYVVAALRKTFSGVCELLMADPEVSPQNSDQKQ